MNKTTILFLANLFCTTHLFAQGKEGNAWVLGYPTSLQGFASYAGGSLLKFDNGAIDTSKFDILRSMSSPASIADENGDLLFYSNGCDVLNKNHQIMTNGVNLNEVGMLYDLYCANALKEYGGLQDMVILPIPKQAKKYIIIHIRYINPGQAISYIRYTTVDMDLDGGLGAVVEKNVNIPYGGVVNGYMTATRHGNGTDWWITLPEWHTTRKFVFLLDSLGIHGPDIQPNAGILTGSGGNGQAVFSNDGTKYAEVCFFQGQTLDFDRCTGKFSNPRVIDTDSTAQNSTCAGVAFSPNSRYMYVSRCDTVDQFDMSVTDFNSTRLPVITWDGVFDTTYLRGPGYFTMLTAPDDKIYICPRNSKALHIIHNPNEYGADCNYEKWGLELPTIHSGQLPNIPNFRLGAADPACTTGSHNLADSEGYTVFPNPASDYVIISNHNANLSGALTFQLFDIWGKLVLEKTIDSLPYRIELANFAAMGYHYRIFGSGGKNMMGGVLVKVR